MAKRIIKNLILYSASFIISVYLHSGTFLLNSNYDLYFGAFILSWAVSSFVTRKFKQKQDYFLLDKLYTYTLSFFLMLGVLSFIIYSYNLTHVSRFVILNSLLISFSVEIISLLYKNKEKVKLSQINLIYSSKAFTFDIILIGLVNLFILYRINGSIDFNNQNVVLFTSICLSWFAGSFLGYQFHPRHMSRDYWTFIWQYLKSYLIILALSIFSGFVNRYNINEIVMIVYGIIGYSAVSFTGITIYYYIKRHRRVVLHIAGFPVKGEWGDVQLSEKMSDLKTFSKFSFNTLDHQEINTRFKNIRLAKYPGVYEILEKNFDLSSFDYSISLIIKSNDISNIDYLPEGNLQFLLNLEKFNHVHDLNQYLRVVNNKLINGGIFVGNFETVYLRHQMYLKRYPYYFAQLFYFVDFLFNRVFSKIIFLRAVYPKFTNGTNKTISLAEGMGKIYFYGFEILHLKILENTMYFIAKKIKEPVTGINPSTGLIFKMDRIGKNGKFIQIYKLRTMHPYSEYIQDFLYHINGSLNGDKITDDFRITTWGKVLRKFWLDELPMLLNLIKGDLKLVGVRPLSIAKYKLYPDSIQKLRTSTKPGLIPPFYADLPNSFDELLASEEKYLLKYKSNPVKTDLEYFLKCVKNILIKGERSA